MARPAKERKHLFDKRREIMKQLDGEGYDGTEISVIFNIDRSQVTRELKKTKRVIK